MAASAVAVFALIGADRTPHTRGRPAAGRSGIGGDRARLGVERASLYAAVVICLAPALGRAERLPDPVPVQVRQPVPDAGDGHVRVREADQLGVVASGVLASGVVAPGVLASRVVAPGVLASGVVASGVLASGVLASGVVPSRVLASGVLASRVVASPPPASSPPASSPPASSAPASTSASATST